MKPTITRRGAIGVINRPDGCLLVIERSQTVSAPGCLCFPGGTIELGESEQEAVVRELREELAVEVEPIRRIWTSRTLSGLELNWWLTAMAASQVPQPNPLEVARCFWMQPQDIVTRKEILSTNRDFLTAVFAGEVRVD